MSEHRGEKKQIDFEENELDAFVALQHVLWNESTSVSKQFLKPQCIWRLEEWKEYSNRW